MILFIKFFHCRFTYGKFTELKYLAKNPIGFHNEFTDLFTSIYFSLFNDLNKKIETLEKQFSIIIQELNIGILFISVIE